MSTRKSKRLNKGKEEEDDDTILNVNEMKEEDDDEDVSLIETARLVAKKTADKTALFSWIWFVLIALGIFFHESHFWETTTIMAIWFVIQIIGNVLDDDFQTDLFWGVIGIVFRVLFYLVGGVVWVVIKVKSKYLLGKYPDWVQISYENCTTLATEAEINHCKFNAVLPLLVQWSFTWPMNILSVLKNRWLYVFVETLLSWGEAYFIRAFDGLFSSTTQVSSIHPLWALFWTVLYFVAGYAFTHLYLLISVWKGSLPKKLDDRVVGIWNNNESYWQFIVDIKWLVMRWLVTWPFEMLYIGMRHTLFPLLEWLYSLSVRKYVWLTELAMQWRTAEQENSKKEN